MDSTCAPGTPPNTECKVTDPACSDACWDRGDTHGASCAASAGCTMEQIQILLRGGTIEDDQNTSPAQPSAQPSSPATTPTVPPDQSSPPPSQTPVTPSVAEVDESFWENVEEVAALVETAPQPITVPPTTPEPGADWNEPPKGLDYAVIKEITGDVQVQLRSQKDWRKVGVGTKIWHGSIIQTDFDAEVTLDFEGIAVVKVGELTQVAIENFIKNHPASKAAMVLDVELGDMNLDVNPGTFTADVQVRAGNTGAAPGGTHFGVSYNPETDLAVYEIYDGTIEVKSEKTKKIVSLSSSYGKPIKRVEIGKDSEFAFKIAIPGNEWREQQALAASKDEEKSTPPAFWAFIVAGLVALAFGVGFAFYRRNNLKK